MRSAKRLERFSYLIHKQVRLLQCCEMTAPGQFIKVYELGKASFSPTARQAQLLSGEHADPSWCGHRSKGHAANPHLSHTFPVEARGTRAGIRQPNKDRIVTTACVIASPLTTTAKRKVREGSGQAGYQEFR